MSGCWTPARINGRLGDARRPKLCSRNLIITRRFTIATQADIIHGPGARLQLTDSSASYSQSADKSGEAHTYDIISLR
jgi:hypothetical protein